MEVSQGERRQLIAAAARMQEAEDTLFGFRKTWDPATMEPELKTRITGADNRCRLIVEANPGFDPLTLEDFRRRESDLMAIYEGAARDSEAIEEGLSARGVDVEKVLDDLGR